MEELLLHERWIERLARALLRDDEDAARDVAQEARVALWQRPPREAGKTRSWLRVVMENLARNRARAQRTRDAALARAGDEDAGAVPSPEALAARVQLHRRLGELVTALDEPFRQVLLLRYYEDCPPRRSRGAWRCRPRPCGGGS